jgi:hypothetical protein
MSLKTWFLGTNAGSSKRTTLHFYDDESFGFRRLPIKDTFFILKEGDKVKKAWCHYFKTQFQFNGYRGFSGDNVTITYDRDIFYDPYNILKPTEKPDKTGRLNQAYISRIATSKIYEAQKQKKSSMMMDRVTWGLLGIIGTECLVLLVSRISCGGG